MNRLEREFKELRKIAKKGTLIKKMKKEDDFRFAFDVNNFPYKKSIGNVPIYNLFRTKIKSVYVIVEDFDGTIKYFDYPQY